jgi:hypothetical protein
MWMQTRHEFHPSTVERIKKRYGYGLAKKARASPDDSRFMRRREDPEPQKVLLHRRTRARRNWKRRSLKPHLRRSINQQSDLARGNSVQQEPQDRAFRPLRPRPSPGNHRARYMKKKDNLRLHGKKRKASLGLH